ncbi:MAG: flavodoxin-dependent (E)-4-hydroxy-3-methylbut-2-enyl-diphosphate synthase, partial [Lentisphaerae bacterium]|nr:flavodoxin-dependent (E)-4-hydroxy-3-methylbut-2-enyl-diphosphate synthase [Lentisphaerota bacterium]
MATTRQIKVGPIPVGGSAPVTVQSMTNTDTRDIDSTVDQLLRLQAASCDIARLAVPDSEAADAISKIRPRITMPLVADIHFDWRLAIASLDAGADALRINPGNIGSEVNVRKIVERVREKKVPLRIGVNSGSVEKDLLAKHGFASADALVESALRHVQILERCGYHEIKISVKASSVQRTIEAYRKLAGLTDYPLHLGVTEAGTLLAGSVKSGVALGILLNEGIGDTIRVSLTDDPVNEIKAGLCILRSLALRP